MLRATGAGGKVGAGVRACGRAGVPACRRAGVQRAYGRARLQNI